MTGSWVSQPIPDTEETKLIGQRFQRAQLAVDDHGLDAIDHGRGDIRGKLQVRIAAAAGAFRLETGHHAAQALSPVAGTELTAITGLANDEERILLFCRFLN